MDILYILSKLKHDIQENYDSQWNASTGNENGDNW